MATVAERHQVLKAIVATFIFLPVRIYNPSFKIGSYWVYFWENENDPLELIHVHVSKGAPQANATKTWIIKAGKCLLANNNSNIESHILNNILRIIEARSEEVISKWVAFFGDCVYYC